MTRQQDGSVAAMLNVCRHRGTQVCRVDQGNAKTFTCSYHGWVYDSTGRHVTNPNIDTGYRGELDLERSSLVPVAQVEVYKGLIFGTFDETAPPLLDFLGGMAPYLDLLVDRIEGGAELVGPHKWIIPANWKLGAENFAGDATHGMPTHASAFVAYMSAWQPEGVEPGTNPLTGAGGEWPGMHIAPGNGHNVVVTATGEPNRTLLDVTLGSTLAAYYVDVLQPSVTERHGDILGDRFSQAAGTVFPNLSFIIGQQSLRVWHPRGPDQMELWAWAVLDKEAPPEVKEAQRLVAMRSFSPSGIIEQDDTENWSSIQLTSRGAMARELPLSYQLGIGHDVSDPVLPGTIATQQSELPMREMFRFLVQVHRVGGLA